MSEPFWLLHAMLLRASCACCEANDATLLPPALVVSCRARPLLASSALAFALAAAVDERAVLAAACGAAAGEGCACCI